MITRRRMKHLHYKSWWQETRGRRKEIEALFAFLLQVALVRQVKEGGAHPKWWDYV